MKTNWCAMFAGATLLALSAPASTQAADLYGGSMKDSYIPPPMMSAAPSWYFRLDGGYSAYDAPVMVEDGVDTLSQTSINGSWSLSGGVGRYFSENIRGDLTYEYRFEANAKGSQLNPNADVPGTREFGLNSHLFLANLYYDFNNRSRFTPYLGVGLGFARHTTSEGTITNCNCTGTIDGETVTDVAGALMAGFSVALRDRLKLDAGYRFLYMGEATTGPLRAVFDGNNFTANDPTIENIHAHEIRFGLRYDFR